MFNPASPCFSLENFEGPLELLLYLVQKNEIDICEVTINQLTEQFISNLHSECEVDMSSDVLALASSLLLFKSQKLIPTENVETAPEEEPHFELIQNLIEYCRFKEAAKALSQKEEEQKVHFSRAPTLLPKEVGTGLEEVGIDDLKNLLMHVLARADQNTPQIIQDEEWHVSEKMTWFRGLQPQTLFIDVFSEKKCREELIVLFLALLELMKLQEVTVVKEGENIYITRYETRT